MRNHFGKNSPKTESMAHLDGQRESKLFSTVLEVDKGTHFASAYYEGTVIPGESQGGFVRIAYDDKTEEKLPVRLDEALEGPACC